MKERLLTMLAAVALLVTVLQPALPLARIVGPDTLDGMCQSVGMCGG